MFGFIDDIIQSFKPDPRVIDQRQLARELQWGFAGRRNLDRERTALKQIKLLEGNGDKRLVAVLSPPSAGFPGRFRIYDYVYLKDFKKRITTVLEYTDSDLELTPFMIHPKGNLNFVRSWFKKPEISPFALTPQFEEHYELSCQQMDKLRKDLNEDFLDEIGDVPGWTYEGYGPVFVAYLEHTIIATPEVTDHFDHFLRICDRLLHGEAIRTWDKTN
jgi:hypothetical protein